MSRRIWITICTVIMFVVTLCGCQNTGDQTLTDGTYRAEMSAESHGYKDYVEITVTGGKIDAVVFDAVAADGKRKSEDDEYKNAMIAGNRNAGVAETYPAVYMKQLADQLLETQKIDQVDTVAGATTSSDDFKTLVQALMGNLKSGNTQTVVVNRSGA